MTHASFPSPLSHSSSELHVVLGAGQIGRRLTEELLARGHRVRLVRKTKTGPSHHPHLELQSGDMSDLSFAAQATQGASVVYDCTNPPYDQWSKLLLPLVRGVLDATSRAEAKLVVLDNLYAYGLATTPLTENSPLSPQSKKGELRAKAHELRIKAHERGDLQLTVARASDFLGPDLPLTMFGHRTFERLFAGKPAECMGNPDMPHSYTFAPDIPPALIVLGQHDDALGQVWHLPTPPAESSRALIQRLGRALDLDAEMVGVPRIILRAMGLFSPFMREVAEMAYQWDAPFIVDDSKFKRAFGVAATPLDDAVHQTADWARKQFQTRDAA